MIKHDGTAHESRRFLDLVEQGLRTGQKGTELLSIDFDLPRDGTIEAAQRSVECRAAIIGKRKTETAGLDEGSYLVQESSTCPILTFAQELSRLTLLVYFPWIRP
uniref:Uncharacterized protein n=1 Tax=Grammatophora oceanica TaxID=210454 RepID=A0A7S1VGS9_9STRA|mmetsp:Transcript_45977/g.68422  ORF Transcript_45977/g.68422 Transcript_45977/m.68422 type:complete len:105 (+) Transcript_45977:1220-1534(+)